MAQGRNAGIHTGQTVVKETPPKVALSFRLPEGGILPLVSPLNGQSDAGDTWRSTIREFLTSSLYFRQTTGNPFLMNGDSMYQPSLMGLYIDDILSAGTPYMVHSFDSIARRFFSKALQSPPLTFAGSEIEKMSPGFLVHQSS